MLDQYSNRVIRYPLKMLLIPIRSLEITPNQLTLSGFFIGLLALPLLWQQQWGVALGCIAINRILDGLDGALARQFDCKTDRGGFLDIVLDFIFYAAVIVGFALASPAQNALPATFLLFSFIGTASSFLAFAIMAERQGIIQPSTNKSLYYLGGLTEGTETVLFYVAFCLWPSSFPYLASLFAILCLLTTFARIRIGWQQLDPK